MNFIQNIDFQILNFIQENLRCSFLDFLMPYITALANGGAIWIIAMIILLSIKKYRKTGFIMAVTFVIGLISVNLLLKPIVGRIRPFDINNAITLLIRPPHDYSFPSGHTMFSIGAATVLLMQNKKLGIFAMVVAVLISFSRLYLYVHFPTDVLVGAIIGVVAAFLAKFIVDKFYLRKSLLQ